jgi:hypothetical protein
MSSQGSRKAAGQPRSCARRSVYRHRNLIGRGLSRLKERWAIDARYDYAAPSRATGFVITTLDWFKSLLRSVSNANGP